LFTLSQNTKYGFVQRRAGDNPQVIHTPPTHKMCTNESPIHSNRLFIRFSELFPKNHPQKTYPNMPIPKPQQLTCILLPKVIRILENKK
jgi:hypothetical protein